MNSPTEEALKKGRELVAQAAEREGENLFAAEVRAGCWDHRSDVMSATRDPDNFKPRT